MSAETFTLEQLGLEPEDLQQRLVVTIASSLMERTAHDEDGVISRTVPTRFANELRDKLHTAIDEQVAAIAEEHIIPRVGELIENATLQGTTEWGEKTGEPLTFTQYLVQRAEAYLTEPVDYDGKSVERSRYSGSKQQTRVTYLVDKHLHNAIGSAMKDAVKNANQVLGDALAETAKIKLSEIAEQLQVKIEPRR